MADVAFLKRSVVEIANKYQEAYLWGQENRENSGDTPDDNQYDIDRQAQLAIYLKEGEKQLGELKERSRQELLEQQKQRDEFQQEQLDIEKAMELP